MSNALKCVTAAVWLSVLIGCSPASASIDPSWQKSYDLAVSGKFEESKIEFESWFKDNLKNFMSPRKHALTVVGDVLAGKLDEITALHMLNGLDLLEKEKYGAAEKELRIFLDAEPNYAKAHDALGYAHFKNGSLKDAITEFDKAISLEPKLYEALYNRGQVYFIQGEFLPALSDLRRAAAIAPQDYFVRKSIGTVLSYMGKTDEAVAEYDLAIELNPREVDAYVAKGLALEVDRPAEAIDYLTQAIELDPTIARIYAIRGGIYERDGRLDLAKLDSQKAVELDPNDFKVVTFQASLLARDGKFEEATALYARFLDTGPKRVYAYFSRGSIYAQAGSYDLAMKDFDKALELIDASERHIDRQHHKGGVYFEKAKIYVKQQRYKESIADFTRSIDASPEPYSYGARGEAYFNDGQYENAIRDFKKEIELSQDSQGHSVYYYMAICLDRLGRKQEALDDLKQFVSRTKNTELSDDDNNHRKWALGRIKELEKELGGGWRKLLSRGE